MMRTLLIDNHDSYTYNLFQLITQVNGIEPVVMVNDDPELLRCDPGEFGGAVISPGPGRPQRPGDIGHVGELLQRTDIPVLGVCLGHQLIAYEAGAAVEPAPRPRHGYLSTVRHSGDLLFAGIPREFTAVRYHSLHVRVPLPGTLIPTAWAEDGVLMALRHASLPRWGVQFHPESVATEFGRLLLTNFAQLARRERWSPVPVARRPLAPPPRPEPVSVTNAAPAPPATTCTMLFRPVATRADTEAIFRRLFAGSPECFWLDSSLVQPGLSRFSFLGDTSGPLGETLTYRVGDAGVTVTDAAGTRSEPGSAFDVLGRRLRERRIDGDDTLPFGFTGGYVGYFGYEMKADCGADAVHTARTPDALWIFASRLVAVDHETGVTYLVAIHDGSDAAAADARRWLDETARVLAALRPGAAEDDRSGTGRREAEPPAGTRPGKPPASKHAAPPYLADFLVRDPDGYQRDVEECQRQLAAGESYEICLTTRLHLPFDEDDIDFYLRLRRANPAPYSALLRAAGITVFSSSPERFLRVDDADGTRVAQSKPIKGTAPRHEDPARDARVATELARDPKNRAENLMIVDLVRNDLGQVCEPGSVKVTKYMAVESYATAHQLVSTITGKLNDDVSAVDCVRHCFPGGSMTGAPKLRTMRIIDRLETEARGVYSGALGYFGLAGGADLSIVIRTAIRQGGTLTVGAGGAIVLDSDPAGEYEEMMLKASAPLRAYAPKEILLSEGFKAGQFKAGGLNTPAEPAPDVPPAIVDSWLVEEGKVLAFDAHVRRFAAACGEFFGIGEERVEDFLRAAASRVPPRGRWFPRAEAAVLDGTPGLRFRIRPAPPRGEAVRLWITARPDGRKHPDVKGPDLDWLAAQRQAAVAAGADEAVLLSPDGHVREGATTSILWWRGDSLCAPPEDGGILPGTTRAVLLDAARACGVRVTVEQATPVALDGLEVWAVNALHGIRPVTAWVNAGVRPGRATRASRWNAYLDGLTAEVAPLLAHSPIM
jgi:para-aminobenzoate synthetase